MQTCALDGLQTSSFCASVTFLTGFILLRFLNRVAIVHCVDKRSLPSSRPIEHNHITTKFRIFNQEAKNTHLIFASVCVEELGKTKVLSQSLPAASRPSRRHHAFMILFQSHFSELQLHVKLVHRNLPLFDPLLYVDKVSVWPDRLPNLGRPPPADANETAIKVGGKIIPASVAKYLRPYQREGVEWLMHNLFDDE